MKTISLKTDKISTHYFDSENEVCPVNGEVSEFFEASFSDNLTFDSNYLQYKLTTPSTPCRTLDYFMSTKKTSSILAEEHIANFRRDNLLCEKVGMEMRDGTSIPVVMVYDRRFYTEDSPWILFTRGIDSCKDDLGLQPHRLSLTDRGIVCAFPLIRGTNYFDSDWLLSGTGERKLTHFNDLIDTAIFIKENELAPKVAVHGSNTSGALTALTSMFFEPFLFEGVAVHNPICDLPSHLTHDIGKRLSSTSKHAIQAAKVQMAK